MPSCAEEGSFSCFDWGRQNSAVVRLPAIVCAVIVIFLGLCPGRVAVGETLVTKGQML